jgi:excinuclease ABC subunit A
MKKSIHVIGAREHNLKNIDVDIPKNQLTVITGVSGSGKSSLAFDTIYAEGQRRYLETFGNYARQFMGNMERPEVESITGLSPVISIEQKSINRNPRSTVGTITEIYDLLRLLFARIGTAHSYHTGKPMVQFTEREIVEEVLDKYSGDKVVILAPIVRGRKGHYRELFVQILKQGYTKVRVDGEIMDIIKDMKLDRYKVHDIEVVIDRIRLNTDKKERLSRSIATAMKIGNDLVFVHIPEEDELEIYSKNLMCAESGIAYEEPSPNAFSFNSPYGACQNCGGLGTLHEADMEKMIPDASISLGSGGLLPLGEERKVWMFNKIKKIAKKYNFSIHDPISTLPKEAMDHILHGKIKGQKRRKKSDFEGIVQMVERWYKESSSMKVRNWAEDFMSYRTCSVCEGERLKRSSRYFLIHGKNISEVSELDMTELMEYVDELPRVLKPDQLKIGAEVIKEIRSRIRFILDVGLSYLQLSRESRTLSGGEAQRIRLASQIGSQLTGISYILDEPSIGLHQRDNHRLIQSLKQLSAVGNTVIVVEHDKDIMLDADYLIDLGPGAGKFGGSIVSEGIPKKFMQSSSTTASYLTGEKSIEVPSKRRKGNGRKLKLTGATGHNLKEVNLEIPLGTFTCITGVSGSGKSSLINGTLYPILRSHFYKSLKKPLPYKKISGIEYIDKIIEIDQSPIGRSPRSNPATYTGVFTEIRNIFSELPESKIRGYKPGRFSFNVKGGRCEACKGYGVKTIEMNFLPDMHVECDVCNGKRYNRETLEVLYKGKSISEVLDMSIDEAMDFFSSIPKIHRRLKALHQVGLGYVNVGQQATTLSGGEAQRVKLSDELSKRDTGNTLYILDEPTTGLHFQDIEMLLKVLEMLVDKGNTVILIEHNMDMIKKADWIIDLGPEGGKGGGRIVYHGTPENMIGLEDNYTAQFLSKEL